MIEKKEYKLKKTKGTSFKNDGDDINFLTVELPNIEQIDIKKDNINFKTKDKNGNAEYTKINIGQENMQKLRKKIFFDGEKEIQELRSELKKQIRNRRRDKRRIEHLEFSLDQHHFLNSVINKDGMSLKEAMDLNQKLREFQDEHPRFHFKSFL